MTFLGWRPFFFFLEITCFRPEKPLEIPISTGKSQWNFSADLFFRRSPVFGRKIPLNFCTSHLVPLIKAGVNFLCPRAPFEFTQNKLLVLPQSRYPGAGPATENYIHPERTQGCLTSRHAWMKYANSSSKACDCIESKWKQTEFRLDIEIKLNIKKLWMCRRQMK